MNSAQTITPSLRRLVLVSAATTFFALLLPDKAWAHPDLLEQIDRLSTEIKSEPDNAGLYLQRAEVYRQHAQFVEALADVDNARKAKADISLLHLASCKIYGETGKPSEALQEADALLAKIPNHAETLALRARANVALGHTNAAVANYTSAINNYKHPEPDLVLERMRLQMAAGKTADAITELDQVMKRIGPAIQLQTAAIECERATKHYEGALKRLETILARMPVKEPWLLQRAELLEESGRKPEAKVGYQQVLEGLKQYPVGRQSLVVNREMAERARVGLQRVSSNTATTAETSLSLTTK